MGYIKESMPGDEVEMELNLKSDIPERRSLHLFIGGEQQKLYVSHIPSSVIFTVYLFCLINILYCISFLLYHFSNYLWIS